MQSAREALVHPSQGAYEGTSEPCSRAPWHATLSPAENAFKSRLDRVDVSPMAGDAATETLDQVSGALWRRTLLTACVLAGCLAVLAALIIF